jgi:hypothetical protein
MFSIEELSQAFATYRKKAGHRGRGGKYPGTLKDAVRQFRANNHQLTIDALAISLGLSSSCVRKWIKPGLGQGSSDGDFLAAAVDIPSTSVFPLQIEARGLVIQFRSQPSFSEMEKVIKLLLAG